MKFKSLRRWFLAPENALKRQILIPFALLLIFIGVTVVGTTYVVESRVQQRALDNSIKAVDGFWQFQVNKDVSKMDALIDILTDNDALGDLVAKRDRAALEQKVAPIFEHLHDMHNISELYFDAPDRTNILRAHAPERSGGIINRLTTRQAVNAEGTAYGIEVGVLGTLTLRVVRPWQRDGKTIGVVEMGEDISGVAQEVSQILHLDLLVLVRKDLINARAWQVGRKIAGVPSDWNQFPVEVALAQTMDTLPKQLVELIKSGSQTRRLISSDGGHRLLQVAFLPLTGASGIPLGNIVVLRDVTALHASAAGRAEFIMATSGAAAVLVFIIFLGVLNKTTRSLEQKRELQQQFLKLSSEHERMVQIEKLSGLGQTIAEIAHQLNNPLVGVINLAQLAERSVDDTNRTRNLLGEIRRAGEDCRAFVQRMLEFSKVSPSERKPAEIQDLIAGTVALLQQSMVIGGRVRIEVPPRPVVLNIYPVLLRHALFNLITNAVQASPADVEIVVRLEAEQARGENWWKMSVIDSGPGVPKHLRDKIFVPFFSTRKEGTGLGLPVAQYVAAVHFGWLDVTGQPEGGACFTIWLPVKGEETSEVTPESGIMGAET